MAPSPVRICEDHGAHKVCGGIAAVVQQREKLAFWKTHEAIAIEGFAEIFLRRDADGENGSEVQ